VYILERQPPARGGFLVCPRQEGERVNFSITTEAREDPFVMHAGGDLDVYTAPQLKAAFDKVGLAGKTIVLDLSGVHFIDSSALGMLVAALQQNRTYGGEVYLVMDDPHLLKIFRITGFDTLFSIFPEVADALAAA
jgi:anti-sigma B factor antagonist